MAQPPPISDEARAVHAAATIIDLHADTPKFMSRGYDFFRRHAPSWFTRRVGHHVDAPRMREGNQRAQFFTFWTFPYPARGCAADVHRQLDALDAAERLAPGELVAARSGDDVRAAEARGQIAGLRGIEGGHALEGKIENLEAFARRGVRYLGLLHFSRSALGFPAFGAGRDHHRGLLPFGVEVVDACARLGVLVDLAHVNRRGFEEAAARRPGPLLVSHTGVAGVRRHWRNIDDDQIRVVADSGGVVGVIFAPMYVGGHLDAVVDHLLHVIRIGGEDAVALGSDWDGFVRPCRELPSPAALPRLTDALLRRGVAPGTIHKLLGKNVLRVLDAAPPRV